jgi:transcriptional regulator with XRE-family HTH domain
MKIDAELLRETRQARGWTQQRLADAAGVHRRTIQRVERSANASAGVARALASALGIELSTLSRLPDSANTCPECGAASIYRYEGTLETTQVAVELLPNLGLGPFSAVTVCPVVCAHCGLVRLFASAEARRRMRDSEHWASLPRP